MDRRRKRAAKSPAGANAPAEERVRAMIEKREVFARQAAHALGKAVEWNFIPGPLPRLKK